MLDKSIGIPLHIQLTDKLSEQIDIGKLNVHEKLPSERKLCEQYDVSRITVRNALSELIHKGYVYSVSGKGNYVAEFRLEAELEPLISFSEDIAKRGMRNSSEILEAEIIIADEFLEGKLLVLPGVEVVKLKRLRLANGIPLAIQHTFLPHHLCPEILKYDFTSHSLLNVLKNEYKLKLTRAESQIEAALALPEEISLLRLSSPSAVLIAKQTTYLENNLVIEFVKSVFAGDKYTLHK